MVWYEHITKRAKAIDYDGGGRNVHKSTCSRLLGFSFDSPLQFSKVFVKCIPMLILQCDNLWAVVSCCVILFQCMDLFVIVFQTWPFEVILFASSAQQQNHETNKP